MLCKLQIDDKRHDLPQLGSTALVFSFGAGSEEHHESTARKRCARRKRAIGSARKLRPSTRLAEKERPNFEDPSPSSASRVQVARVDFSGASRRLRRALLKTHLLSNPDLLSGDDDHDDSLHNLLCKLQLRN